MNLPRPNPDAVFAPRPFLPNGREPHGIFQTMFGPLLGGAIIARAQVNQYFITAGPEDSIHFAKTDPLHPAERYDYVVVSEPGIPYRAVTSDKFRAVPSYQDDPDTIRFAFLRDRDSVAKPALSAKINFTRGVEAWNLDYQTKVARYVELQDRSGTLNAAEKEEFRGLKDYIVRVSRTGPVVEDVSPGGVVIPKTTSGTVSVPQVSGPDQTGKASG